MIMKPILFNTEMVRAILDGRKTVTRRVIKPQPRTECYHGGDHEFVSDDFGGKYEYTGFVCRKCGYGVSPPHCKYPCGTSFFRPPYHPGDVLYVRETWGAWSKTDGRMPTLYYKADGNAPDTIRWRPSIHMPKEAARIFRRVTDVRVERLQECGKGWCLEIEKEGIVTPKDPILYIDDDEFHDALRAGMQQTWDTTIKPADLDKYGWDANPWVWVIEYERCDKPEEM